MDTTTVLVTGGTGLVGRALQEIAPNWIYLSSKDGDLGDQQAVKRLLQTHQPSVVIHLAANVGGLYKNITQRLDMFNSNMLINYNVLDCAYQAGIQRVICCLSTCIFPDGLNRVLTESDIHLGEPHESNYGYAYAKRMLEVQCRLYSETEGFHYQCIVPTNIYGPHDNFNLHDSHVIPGLIHKAYLHTQTSSSEPFRILGTGLPRRQFIYSGDLAHILVEVVQRNITNRVLICSTPEDAEVTILDVAKLIAKEFQIADVEPSEKAVGENDGQYIKTASSALLRTLVPDATPTSMVDGIRETVRWFKEHYPHIRK